LEKPIGESGTEALRVTFDTSGKLEFHGAKVISDAGLIACRELDETLGLTAMADEVLRNPRAVGVSRNPERFLCDLCAV